MLLEKIKRNNPMRAGKRRGRGCGSGKGFHTTGSGQKGQKSRTGHKSTLFFEGGNVPYFRRLPKYRGFKNNAKIEYQAVNVTVLEKNFSNGDIVSVDTLKNKGLIAKRVDNVKILSFGKLTKKLTIEKLKVSQEAAKKIIAVKGQIK